MFNCPFALLLLVSKSPGTVCTPLLACLGGKWSLLDRPHPAHTQILLCIIPWPKSAQSTHLLYTLASDWLTFSLSGLPRHPLKLYPYATLCPADGRTGLVVIFEQMFSFELYFVQLVLDLCSLVSSGLSFVFQLLNLVLIWSGVPTFLLVLS